MVFTLLTDEQAELNAELLRLVTPVPARPAVAVMDRADAEEAAWSEAQALIAAHPEIAAYVSRYYRVLGHKFLGRALLGQSFETCRGVR